MDEKSTMVGSVVLVRTHSAGVHVGRLQARDGREVVLSDARRIWGLVGADALSEIAVSGLSRGSRVSAQVPTILVLEAIEIIPVAAIAARRIDDAGDGLLDDLDGDVMEATMDDDTGLAREHASLAASATYAANACAAHREAIDLHEASRDAYAAACEKMRPLREAMRAAHATRHAARAARKEADAAYATARSKACLTARLAARETYVAAMVKVSAKDAEARWVRALARAARKEADAAYAAAYAKAEAAHVSAYRNEIARRRR